MRAVGGDGVAEVPTDEAGVRVVVSDVDAVLVAPVVALDATTSATGDGEADTPSTAVAESEASLPRVGAGR